MDYEKAWKELKQHIRECERGYRDFGFKQKSEAVGMINSFMETIEVRWMPESKKKGMIIHVSSKNQR